MNNSQEENTKPEEGNKSQYASLAWASRTAMRKTILKMAEEEKGDLQAAGSEKEHFLDERPSAYYDTDVDALIEAGMPPEADNGYTIASKANLGQLPGEPEVRGSVIGSAMGSILMANEVRWCGEPMRGKDFADKYLDMHNNLDHQSYETREEYLESIEDYVNCGTGRHDHPGTETTFHHLTRTKE